MLLLAVLLALLQAAVIPLAWARTECVAFAAIQIQVTSGGRCTGRSGSYCNAFSEAQDAFEEAFDEWYGLDYAANVCNKGRAEAAAEAVAEAVASVYTKAYTDVKCDEGVEGSACGFGQTNGRSWSRAVAEAIANALADAGDEAGKGFCLSDIRAVSAVIAEASSKSLTDGCVGGGEESYSFSEGYKISVQKAIATAFAQATVGACQKGFETWTSADCVGEGESTSEGTTDGSFETADSSGSASGTQLLKCRDGVNDKCCNRAYRPDSCRCARENGCEDGLYTRVKDYSDTSLRIWEAPGTYENCVCE